MTRTNGIRNMQNFKWLRRELVRMEIDIVRTLISCILFVHLMAPLYHTKMEVGLLMEATTSQEAK